MRGDTIMLLRGDDGRRKRGLRLLGGNDDVACNGFRKLLNVARVLMMSTLVSFVRRFSIHDLLLVVVFLVDIKRGLVLFFIVRVHLFATRNSPFACWCRHSTCVTLFSQVRLVYLIFAVPQTQEQIVGSLWPC